MRGACKLRFLFLCTTATGFSAAFYKRLSGNDHSLLAEERTTMGPNPKYTERVAWEINGRRKRKACNGEALP